MPICPTRRIRILAVLAGLALGLAVSGCARHVHHHHAHPAPKKIVVLEQEHEDRTVVIVSARPRPERRCWPHGAHWHCRAHKP